MWNIPMEDACNFYQQYQAYDRAVAESTKSFTGQSSISVINDGPPQCEPPHRPKERGVLYKRKPEPKGPLTVFGYDYFADHAKTAGIATPKLLSYEGLWGSGEEYAYEVLNFADGKRSSQQIRDAVSAEYGPISLELVVEYLQALEETGLIEPVK